MKEFGCSRFASLKVENGQLVGDLASTFEAESQYLLARFAAKDGDLILLVWVGISEDEAKAKGVTLGKAVFPWVASGRAVANGRDEGFTKLLFDPETHRILGGAIVGTSAGDMIGELALAIEMGADAADIGHTIHPHPTLGESIGMAAEVFEGVCTDLPPQKKR